MNYPQYNNQYQYYNTPPVQQPQQFVQPAPQPPVMPPVPPVDPVEVKRNEEETAMRKRFNTIGLMLLIAVVVFSVFASVLSEIYKYISTGFTLPASLDSIPDNLLNGLANSAIFGIAGLVFIKILKTEPSEALIFKKVGFIKLCGLVAIGFSVSMLSNLLTSLFINNIYTFGVDLNINLDSPVSNSPVEIIIYLLSTALVPAFSEEILFRGAILSGLRKYGDAFAVFVSSLLFGLFHGNFVQIPFAFIVGIILGFTVVYTNSMLPAILIHMSNNAYAVITDVMYSNAESWGISESLIDLANYGFVILVALITIIAVAVIAKRDKKFMYLNKYEGLVDVKTRNKLMMTRPTIIIATVLLVGESLLILLAL